MRYFIGFIILTLLFSCVSEKQEIVRDENGNIILKCELKNGIRHGKCYRYYSTGTVKEISSWVSGVRDGESTDYFEDGNIKTTSMWKEGKIDGECFEYYENGIEKVRSYFINDYRVQDEFFDEDGRVQKEYHYLTVNHQLRINGVVIYDTNNVDDYPYNINFHETMYAEIFADRDTIDYGGFAEYEVKYMCYNDDINVRVFTGDIDHNFNVDNASFLKNVDMDNKNRFYPTKLGTDTLRVVFDFIKKEDGISHTFSSYLEKVFTVIEK